MNTDVFAEGLLAIQVGRSQKQALPVNTCVEEGGMLDGSAKAALGTAGATNQLECTALHSLSPVGGNHRNASAPTKASLIESLALIKGAK